MKTRKLPLLASAPSGDRAVHRRQFLWLASAAAAAFLEAGCSGPETSGSGTTTTGIDDGKLPTSGGAPDTDEGWTIAAFCDTVIPGKHRDPTGAVGAIDVNVPGMFWDPALPALQFVGLLRLVLDAQAASSSEGKKFFQLTYEERDAVLEKLLADEGPVDLAVQMIKAAFYSLPEVSGPMGYPGANDGYLADLDFSFGEALAAQLTPDGNMP